MSSTISPSTTPAKPMSDKSIKAGHHRRKLVAALLILTIVLTIVYTAVSIYMATNFVHSSQSLPNTTPASLGLQYKAAN
jgi:predicted PurR-regulated permease PerM